MQNISIHTLEELCDVLHSESNDITIVLDNDIKVSDVIDISFDQSIDLNGHHLTIADSGALNISDNTTTIENGYIDCDKSAIVNVSGKNTVLQLSQVRLTGEGCLLMIKNRGQAAITSSTLSSTEPDENNCIIHVEGATIAKLNSSLNIVDTKIYGGSYPAISVTKRGILNTYGGLIHTPNSECTSTDESAVVELNDTVLLTDAIEEAKSDSESVEEVEEVVEEVAVEVEPAAEEVIEEPEVVEVDEPVKVADTETENSKVQPTQILLKKPTHIYGSPSTKIILATYIGPVTPVEPFEVIPKPAGNFIKVQFKAPGTNRRYTGYILQ